MSAEAPRNTGKTASVTPQKPEGGFSRFLRRFVGQTQPTLQPPVGLENFADQIQSVIDGHFAVERQRQINMEAARAAQVAALTAEKERVAGEKRDRVEQFKAKEREALKIVQDFQIAERLKYVQRTAWEGMGRIEPIKERLGTRSGSDFQSTVGGLELVHRYPGCYKYVEVLGGGDGNDAVNGRYGLHERFTRLSVKVIHIEHDSGESEYALRISSEVYSSSKLGATQPYENNQNILEVVVPTKAKDSVDLLDKVLVQETDLRFSRGLSPRQLEKEAGNELAESKRKPYW